MTLAWVTKMFFFCGVWGLNPNPYIYYALSLRTELSSQDKRFHYLREAIIFFVKKVMLQKRN